MLLPRLPVLSALLVLLLAAGRCSVLELVGWSPKTRTETRTETEGLTGPGERRSQPGLEGQPRDPRHKEKFIKHLTGPLYFNPKWQETFPPTLPQHQRLHNTCLQHGSNRQLELEGVPLCWSRLKPRPGPCDPPSPDYYKRCARLLTRLANSPRCSER